MLIPVNNNNNDNNKNAILGKITKLIFFNYFPLCANVILEYPFLIIIIIKIRKLTMYLSGFFHLQLALHQSSSE